MQETQMAYLQSCENALLFVCLLAYLEHLHVSAHQTNFDI